MPVICQYLLKVSISLAILYIFYQLLLRRLTFYQHNRFFLLGYSFLSFLIPLADITSLLRKKAETNWLQRIPTVELFIGDDPGNAGRSPAGFWDVFLLSIAAGILVMLIRLVIQMISFSKIRRQAKLLTSDPIQLYQVDKDIIPFSFGQSIFVNHHQHSVEELSKIVRHEFVHVRQLHTIDIIWGEILCILNWYNPFAWLIRHAIRQNLEFIADNKVVDGGVDKKQYQYLLLKVIGSNQYSVTNKFNFSSLKKRIAMMNKIKSSKKQFLRLLFLLPAIAFTLLAFRQKLKQQETPLTPVTLQKIVRPAYIDTPPPFLNEKGYNLTIQDKQGNCLVVVKDKDNKSIKTIWLTDWNKNPSYYEGLYGEIPPPPPPPAPPIPRAPGKSPLPPPPPPVKSVTLSTVQVESLESVTVEKEIPVKLELQEVVVSPRPPVPPVPEVEKVMPANVKRVHSVNNKVEVELKDGSIEKYDLDKPTEKAAFEKKYGKMPDPPKPPAVS